MKHAAFAQKGCKYEFDGKEVLAMGEGHVVEVREITKDHWQPLGPAIVCKASWLKPLPMKYYHGQTRT